MPRPKKIIQSPFTDEEKSFLLEHALRGKIATKFFKLNISKLYSNNFEVVKINKKGTCRLIVFNKENPTPYQEKVLKNENALKEKFKQAVLEADEIGVSGKYNEEIIFYKLIPETDKMLLDRLETKGRPALCEEKKRFKKRMNLEKRRVLFEKIQKPRKQMRVVR